MANTKITELPAASTLDGTESIPLVQGAATKRALASLLPISDLVAAALATKATDSATVHKTGAETIAGVKTFSSPPVVPTPVSGTDAVNKTYADTHAGLPANVRAINANASAAAGDLFLVDATSGPITVTIPAGFAVGACVVVKKIDVSANAVAVVATSGTVDGDGGGLSIVALNGVAIIEHTGANAHKVLASHPTNGVNGSNGNTILNGTGVPGAGLGVNGDYYLRNDTTALYGPKSAGAWPGSGVSLIGASGLGAATPTAVKTANYTAAAGEFVLCDTTGGTFTITAPPATGGGTPWGVKIVAGTAPVTITTQGSDVFNVVGGATGATLRLLNQALNFLQKAGVHVISADNYSLSSLDARFSRGRDGFLPSTPTQAIQENFQRLGATLTSQAALSTGRLSLVEFGTLRAGVTYSGIGFMSAVAGATLTHQWFTFVDKAGNVIAKTVDDAATAWGTNSPKVLLFPTPIVPTVDIDVMTGLVVEATTVPTIYGVTGIPTANDLGTKIATVVSGTITGGPGSLGATIATAPSVGTAVANELYAWAV